LTGYPDHPHAVSARLNADIGNFLRRGFLRLASILARKGPIPIGRSTWWADVKKRLTVFDLLVARCYPANINLRDKLDIALDRVSIKLFDPEGEGIAPVAIPRIISLKEKETARRGEILELAPDVIKRNWDYAVDALEQALELMTTRYGCLGERSDGCNHIVGQVHTYWRSSKNTR
jgi:hypothetical protein